MTWTRYVRRHVKRSMRDVQKVMRLARAPDPQAAADEERAEARERMATVRARQAEAANVRRVEPEPPADWHTVRDLASKLDANGWAQFWDWVVDENERRGLPLAA